MKLPGFDVDLNRSEIDFFLKRTRTLSLSRGKYFQSTGEVCNKIGFVKSGLLKSFAGEIPARRKRDGAEADSDNISYQM